MAVAQPEKLNIPPAARLLVAQSDVIQPLPQLLTKLCGYLDYKSGSLGELARDISVDPKMTAKLLRLANSTSVAVRHRVTNVADAVNLLGARRTVSLVISSNVVQAQSKLLKKLPEEFRNWCHSRNVLIASTASAFARRLEKVLPDTAYVIGLLQDIGIQVLAYTHGKSYQQMLHRIQDFGQVELATIEKKDFGITHADVSAAQLEKWGMPVSIISTVLNHHNTETPPAEKSEQRLLHCLQVGEAMANLADKCTPQRRNHLMRLLATYGDSHAQACKECLAEAVMMTAQSKQIFSIPAANVDVLNQLLKKIDGAQQFDESELDPGTGELAALPELEWEHTPAESPVEPVLFNTADPGGATSSPETLVAPEVPPAASPAPVVERRKTIVLIQDERLLIKFITKVLEPLGLEVRACATFEEARELARDAAVILCDTNLSAGTDEGTDIIRALRREGFAVPVVIMSSDSSRATVTKCIEAGSNAFVLKPLDTSALLDKMSKFTGGLIPAAT